MSDAHTASLIEAIDPNVVPLVIDFTQYGRSYTATTKHTNGQTFVEIVDKRGNKFDLSRVSRVWWRRPQMFANHSDLAEPLGSFVAGETVAFWRGALSTIEGAIWYNHFDVDRLLDRKFYQINLASKVGFPVPDTCVTSNPAEARNFLESSDGEFIYKSFGGSPEFWQPARKYRSDLSNLLPGLVRCPVIFQRYVPGVDYRITVIDDQIFTAEKDASSTPYPYDVRISTKIEYKSANIAAEEGFKIRRFMEASGLRYAAFDFRRAANGDLVFLEVNPAGQYLYIELQTGLKITKALAEALSSPGGSINSEISDEPWSDSEKLFAYDSPDRVSHIR